MFLITGNVSRGVTFLCVTGYSKFVRQSGELYYIPWALSAVIPAFPTTLTHIRQTLVIIQIGQRSFVRGHLNYISIPKIMSTEKSYLYFASTSSAVRLLKIFLKKRPVANCREMFCLEIVKGKRLGVQILMYNLSHICNEIGHTEYQGKTAVSSSEIKKCQLLTCDTGFLASKDERTDGRKQGDRLFVKQHSIEYLVTYSNENKQFSNK